MSNTLTVTFKFPIGTFVYMRDARYSREAQPRPFIVGEHVASWCPGGLQKAYRLVGKNDLVPEIALTNVLRPFQPTPQDVLNDQIRCEMALEKARDKRYREHTRQRLAETAKEE